MKRVAKFEKVSFSQFFKDWQDTFENVTEKECQQIYHQLLLPARATKGSAGYDFFAPISFTLSPQQTIKFPTGIRVKIEEGWVLKCYPRSSFGFQYRLQLNNTVGIIDSDYYFSAKMTNDSKEGKTLSMPQKAGFMQGIFVEYGITMDDSVQEIRNGGFGSTTK